MFLYIMADYSKITASKEAIEIMKNFMTEKRSILGEYTISEMYEGEDGWHFLLCNKKNGSFCLKFLVSKIKEIIFLRG